MQVTSIAEGSKRSFMKYFRSIYIKLPFAIKTFVLSIWVTAKDPLYCIVLSSLTIILQRMSWFSGVFLIFLVR